MCNFPLWFKNAGWLSAWRSWTTAEAKELPHLYIFTAQSAYRIRCGSYRVGLFIEKGDVLIVVIADRKDIYKKFPLTT